MATAVTMPKLGMTMEEGTVIEWRSAPGDAVDKGQIILVIESEKTEIEIEAPDSGVLRHIYVDAGEVVPCGTFLAAVTASADEAFDAEAFRLEHEKISVPAAPAGGGASPERQPGSPETSGGGALPERAAARPAVTPAARKLCKEWGLDPEQIPGSGPGGRVTREDVEAFQERMASRVEVEDGVYIEVRRSGEGPSVVLVPGFGTDVSAFGRQIPALEETFQVAAINPRGVGFSDSPGDAYDLSRAAADVVATIEGRAHLVGASLGAAVALRTALEHGGKVASLTLITPFAEVSPRLSVISRLWCEIAATGNHRALALALAPWMFSADYLGDASRMNRAVSALAQMSKAIPTETLEHSRTMLEAYTPPDSSALAALKVPTLVIVAEGDMLTPDGETVAAAIGDAEVHRIESAGHAVALERPEDLNGALISHLRTAGRD